MSLARLRTLSTCVAALFVSAMFIAATMTTPVI